MKFVSFIVRNLSRRRTRSLLTVIAIAIAVGSMVALVGVSRGFVDSFIRLYDKMGVDLVVSPKGARQKMSSSLQESMGDELRKISGVVEVSGGLMDLISMEDANRGFVLVLGSVPGSLLFKHLDDVQGRSLQLSDERHCMLGSSLADSLGAKVGDKLPLMEDEVFEVVGIYKSNIRYEDNFVIIPLAQLQRLMYRPGQVNGFNIALEKPMTEQRQEEIIAEIERRFPNVTVKLARDHISSIYEIQAVQAMAWLVSLVALVMGIVGIMNTMVMAVNERTREIGLLRAIGWAKSRIARMVISESLALSVVGAVIGIGAAIGLVKFLATLEQIKGYIDSNIAPNVMVMGALLALVVGLLGGVLPALRAANIPPTHALRHE